MHPRNLYNKKPDFGELATVRPSLKPYLIPKSKQSTKQDSDQQQSTDHEKSSTPTLLTSNSACSSTLSSAVDQEKEHQEHSVVTNLLSSSEADLAEQQSEKRFAYTLDFSDPAALRELTCAVLERDFGLKVEIPLDKLIPAVPQRLNYVHWIEDLLMCCEDSVQNRASEGADSAVGEVDVATGSADSSLPGGTQMEVEGVASSDSADSTVCNREKKKGVSRCWKEGVASGHADVAPAVPKGDSILGIDIGTGASCIYPLLGTSLNGWRFLATEIDDEAVKFAQENVSTNDLDQKIDGDHSTLKSWEWAWEQSRLTLKQVSTNTFLSGAINNAVQYSFCMCNPPFFKDREERYGGGATHSELRPPPGTFSSGTLGETVTAGGEVEFVKRIIRDSLTLRKRVRWYSSMLGKKASVKQILSELKQHKIPVTTTTEFVQGKTWRWGVAWSFDESIKEKVESMSKPTSKRPAKRQQPLVLTLPTDTGSDVRESFIKAKEWFLEQLTQLQIDYTYTATNEPKKGEGEGDQTSSPPLVLGLHCVAKRNTWSHQRRRRRLMERLQAQQSSIAHGTNGAETDNKESGLQGTNQTQSSSPSKAQEVEAERGKGIKEINREIESLSPPCQVELQCSLLLTELPGGSTDGDSKKNPTRSQVLQGGAAAKKAKLSDEDGPPSKLRNKMADDSSYEPGSKVKGRRGKKSRKKGGTGGSLREYAESAVGESGSEQLLCIEFEWISGDDKDMLHQIVQYFRNKCQNVKF